MESLTYRGHWSITDISSLPEDQNHNVHPPCEFDGELRISADGVSQLTSYGSIAASWTMELWFGHGRDMRFTVRGVVTLYTTNATVNLNLKSITLYECQASSPSSFISGTAVVEALKIDEELCIKEVKILIPNDQLTCSLDLNQSKNLHIQEHNLHDMWHWKTGTLPLGENAEGGELDLEMVLEDTKAILQPSTKHPLVFHWKFNDPITLIEVQRLANSFHDLLSLLVDHPVDIDKITLGGEESEDESFMIMKLSHYAAPSPRGQNSLAKLTTLEDRFMSIFTKWQKMEKEHPQILSQMMEDIYTMGKQEHFFALLVALEQYHREICNEENKNEERITEIIKKIKPVLNETDSKFVQNRLQAGPSCRDRYTWCLSVLSQMGVTLSNKEFNRLVNDLLQERNGYAHELNGTHPTYYCAYLSRIASLTLKALLLDELNMLESVKEELKRQWIYYQDLLAKERKRYDRIDDYKNKKVITKNNDQNDNNRKMWCV